MDPKLWGPMCWNMMFDMAEIMDVHPGDPGLWRLGEEWFFLLGFIMPCKHCRESYQLLQMKTLPSPLVLAKISPVPWTEWVFTLKNFINLKLRKDNTLLFDTVLERRKIWGMQTSEGQFDIFVNLVEENARVNQTPEQEASTRTYLSSFVPLTRSLFWCPNNTEVL